MRRTGRTAALPLASDTGAMSPQLSRSGGLPGSQANAHNPLPPLSRQPSEGGRGVRGGPVGHRAATRSALDGPGGFRILDPSGGQESVDRTPSAFAPAAPVDGGETA
jgi:hypothetical protein